MVEGVVGGERRQAGGDFEFVVADVDSLPVGMAIFCEPGNTRA